MQEKPTARIALAEILGTEIWTEIWDRASFFGSPRRIVVRSSCPERGIVPASLGELQVDRTAPEATKPPA